MAEYYSEIVFPDPFESFFTYVCYYLAVHISNLPLGNLKSFSFPLAMNVNNREKFARNFFKNADALAHLICDCLKSSLVIRYYIGCKLYVRSFLVKHKHHSSVSFMPSLYSRGGNGGSKQGRMRSS
ncbi:hypothetical protein Bca4012_041804 [Brassica carinata]|uniref:Uncharacterized protein n=1 Tax=Brassica carinata TaxID=52824 RepID=A0A8X7UJ56_BRACI|nr:hypothetical protein Bca52824_060406 [Brassica carinata]